MIDIGINKLNSEHVYSLFADYDDSTDLYDDRLNWANSACNRCSLASNCAYNKYEPYNNSSCFRFKWIGNKRVEIVLRRRSHSQASEERYYCLKEGTARQ